MSEICRSYGYNSLGVAAQGKWHPFTLKNGLYFIQFQLQHKHNSKNRKLHNSALHILLTLTDYHAQKAAITEQKEELFDHYRKTNHYSLFIYSTISSEKVKGYSFASCIRIHTIYRFLHCAWSHCNSHKSLKGILKMSYCLSRYIEKYYPMRLPIDAIANEDNPCLFGSAKENFSTAYCKAVFAYFEKLFILKLYTKNRLLIALAKKINIAWHFIQRELRFIYKQRHEAISHNPEWIHYGDSYVKLFLPEDLKQLIQIQWRVYYMLRRDGFGTERFFYDIAQQVKSIPNGPNTEAFQIMMQDDDVSSQWFNYAQNEQDMTRLGDIARNIIIMFKSRKKIRFLKNFLYGKYCNQCLTNNQILKLCKGCQTTFYCSRKCQKTQWKSHKRVCS
eukprot:599773_1